jgi:signal transduction histidine kinase
MATLASLTDDVFEIAMIDAGQVEIEPRPFAIHDVIDQVVGDVKTSEPQRSIDTDVDVGVAANRDHPRTWQILNKQVTNAMKFSPPELPITITAHEIVGPRAQAMTEITVTDLGPGIPADDQDRIFDRFTRLPRDGAVPGSGMGLFIARSLAEAQGGSVAVSSDGQSGSTFCLRLPAAQPTAH